MAVLKFLSLRSVFHPDGFNELKETTIAKTDQTVMSYYPPFNRNGPDSNVALADTQ